MRNVKKGLLIGFVLVDSPGKSVKSVITIDGKYELHSPSIYADRMVRSLRLAMPNVTLVQFSDMTTPMLPGVDFVERCPYRDDSLMEFRLGALAALAKAADCRPWLQLDTDLLILKDLSPVLENDFDIAMLRRTKMLDPNGVNLAETMPYNTGVIFGRGSKVPELAYEILFQSKSPEYSAWFGDQRALSIAIEQAKPLVYDIGQSYNYTPSSVVDVPDHVSVVHYKGAIRKQWMIWHADYLLARSLHNGLVPKAVYEKYQEEVSRGGGAAADRA